MSNWKENFIKAFKNEKSKKLSDDEVEKIKKEAVEQYKNSEEHFADVNEIVKKLGDEWFAIYSKQNVDKNANQKSLDEIEKEVSNEKKELEKLLEENKLVGYGKNYEKAPTHKN